jgi:hypothetical protein
VPSGALASSTFSNLFIAEVAPGLSYRWIEPRPTRTGTA